MTTGKNEQATGYDRYVNWKTFSIAVAAFVGVLLVPTTDGMVDVAVEYSAGERRVQELLATELFERPFGEVEQWQALSVRALERSVRQSSLSQRSTLDQDASDLRRLGIDAPAGHFARHRAFVESMTPEAFRAVMERAHALRFEGLSVASLDTRERTAAVDAAWKLKLCLALTLFVVICFLTEAIPLPGVAFCIGLALVFGGVVSSREVASLFWSDACWFIMGSLMFAAAFVKTGVDRRVCLFLFSRLARPGVGAITAILICVISPAAAFISDHALAAMFLPVAMILYSSSKSKDGGIDSELAKMLVLTVAMACNIGGFGAPSGGARNVIMITYMDDMFDVSISYARWMLYGMPFVLIMMPFLWLMLRLRFKPQTRDLRASLESLRDDIARMGGWNRKQIITLVIFLAMFLGWVTADNALEHFLGYRLGIGVIAVTGAVAYMLTGVVNWRDYQTKVDWGVVWLYAGALIFGRCLDQTGAAYWIARSMFEGLSSIGFDSGAALLAVGGLVTATVTNLMADGPAAAAVGPVTLSMANLAAPGAALVPQMGLVTACSSSMAYLLIIGTPPNAIVYASGVLKPKDFLRVGIPCMLAAFALMLAMSTFYWPLVGLVEAAAP
jgi:anion transporter